MSLLDFLFVVAAVFFAGYETGRNKQAKRDLEAVDEIVSQVRAKGR